MTRINAFRPDWVSPPGHTIADILQGQGLQLEEFANRIGQSPEHANALISGRATITQELAKRLEHGLGGSAAFWLAREEQYRDDVARLCGTMQSMGDREWLSTLPLKDMIKFGWVEQKANNNDQTDECLDFFAVSNLAAWQEAYSNILEMAVFRTSPTFASNPGAVAAWLRRGEIESESISCKPWDARCFQEALLTIRSLTREKDPDVFLPKLKNLCADCGVAVVIVRAPSGCRASGATRFLSPNKALLLLSFRYLSDDHFWFTFFHEAGHLLLHNHQRLFLEGVATSSTTEEEEANEFSARILVPSEYQVELRSLHADSHAVIKFARRVGVSPGIIVGQLQHMNRIKPNQLNSLKRRYHWTG